MSQDIGTYLSVASDIGGPVGVFGSSTSTLSVDDIAGCLNLHQAWHSLGEQATAWYYLQQAITIAQVLGVDQWDPASEDAGRRIRAYYLL